MTSKEYDYNRLQSLPAAIKTIEKLRYEVGTENAPAWAKLHRTAEKLRQQLSQEWEAFFAPEPEPPAPDQEEPKGSILKASAEAQGMPVTDLPAAPEIDAADLKGLPHTHRCPDCRNLTPCYANVPNCADPYKVCADCAFKGLPGLQSLLATARAEGRATSPFNPADYPTGAKKARRS